MSFSSLQNRFLVLLMAWLVCMPSAKAGDWEQALDRKGIKVWTRALSDYPIHEVRAETTVKSTLSGLVALIMDTDNASRWVYRTDRIELLQRDDATGSFLIRVVTDFPWPLDDRDAMVEGRIVQDPQTGVVTVRSQSLPLERYPAASDIVHMPDVQGTWTFRPLPGGLVQVGMTMRANPGGSIPPAVVNLIVHETPFRTLLGLRRVVSEPRYQSVRLSQIRELP